MEEEIKKEVVDEALTQEVTEEQPEAQPEKARGEDLTAEPATQDEQKQEDNHVAVRRGRLIAAGILAAVILATLAVVVAGVFQFTSAFMRPCAVDLRVNDPAPVLWHDLTTEKTKRAPLGVPSELAEDTAWKRGQTASD